MVGDAYFSCKACPFDVDCSKTAWSRAQVWDFDLESAKVRLKNHLQRSSLHTKDLKESLKGGTTLDEVVAMSEWEVLELSQNDLDVQRDTEKPGPSKRHKREAHQPRDPPTSSQLADGGLGTLITNAVQSGVHTALGPLAFASPVSRPSQLAIRGVPIGAVLKRPNCVPVVLDPEITVRSSELKVALDSVWRAHDAAKNAQKLCTSAATAFAAEVDRLEESGMIIAAMISASAP